MPGSTAFDHAGDTEDVGVEQRPGFIDGGLLQGADAARAGVVDQHVDASGSVEDIGHARLHRRLRGHIELECVEAGGSVGAWSAHGAEDAVTLLGEQLRGRLSDAREAPVTRTTERFISGSLPPLMPRLHARGDDGIIPNTMNNLPGELPGGQETAPQNPGSPGDQRGRRPPGRRPGDSRTYDDVMAAARRQFGEHGYDRTTMRSVAIEAGVDPKLVYHYFGSKQQLFVTATELPFRPAQALPGILAGDPDRIGERMAGFALGILDNPSTGSRMIGLVRAAAAEPVAASMVRDLFAAEFVAPATQILGSDRPQLRMNLLASQLVGLVMERYVIRAEPLASLSPDEVVSLLAPTLQRYLAGHL
jgi:AcrR family transcriptional regulator